MSAPGTLGRAVEAYLGERRRLGFQMTGSELRRFARYADAQGHEGALTAKLQINWARLHVRRTTPGTGTRRLQTLRPFVVHYRQHEPGSEVLDPRILGPVRGRPTPHIYTPEELAALIEAAAALDGGDGLRGATYATLFGLIAAAGLRLSEAIDLKDADVDLAGGRLTVRLTKFRKTRRLPLQESTVAALASWRGRRDRRWPRDADGPFFVGHRGTALSRRNVHSVFESLRRSLGWQARGSHPAPRIHDLRHTFAVRRVQLWHEEGTSVAQAMFWLCTYLGHAKISDTYWYLTGVPELMGVAGRHFELFVGAPAADGEA